MRKKFKVLIRGKNDLIQLDGITRKRGFYTHGTECQSGGGPPHSKTLARSQKRLTVPGSEK